MQPLRKVNSSLGDGGISTEPAGQAEVVTVTGCKFLEKPSSLKHDGNHLCQGKQRLNHGLPRAACQGRMGLHMPLILLASLTIAAGNRRCSQSDTQRLYLSPPPGLSSSPVLGRAGDKSKTKAQAVPERTRFNPAAACPRGQDGGQLSWS